MSKTTYLVETWRNAPYYEVLEDDFDNEQDALEYAKATSQMLGVERTKVFSLINKKYGEFEKEVLIKIDEFE